MKKQYVTRWLGSLLLAVIFTLGFSPKQSLASPAMNVSFQVFYDQLAPYGDWVQDNRHGYIWLPAVDQSFHPYGTNGHWAMTEYGNTWVSYYDWGWAPFHYGRWYFDNYYQSWAWVPGYDWGPAWVSWRNGGGHYGWAPLGPGISVSLRVNVPLFHWVFLPHTRIYDRYAWRYYAPHRTRVRIINRTTIINNTVVYNNNTYISGPNRRDVERVTRSRVPVYQVSQSDRPGRSAISRNEVRLYRPDLQNSRNQTASARPSRVVEPSEARSNRSINASPSRSATQSARDGRNAVSPGQRSVEAPSRSENSNVRSANPATRIEGFETQPYDRRTRVATPQQNRKPVVGQNPTARPNGTIRNAPAQNRQPNVRTAPAQRRRATVNSAPQSRQPNVRIAPSQRSSRPAVRPNTSRQSKPAVRNAPASRKASPRVSAPASRQSSPKVTRSAPARTKTAPARTSSSRGRGN